YGNGRRGGIDDEFVGGGVGSGIAGGIGCRRGDVVGSVCEGIEAVVREGPGSVSVVGGGAELADDGDGNGRGRIVHRAVERGPVVVGGARGHRNGGRYGVNGEFVGGGIRAAVAGGVRRGDRHVVNAVGEGGEGIVGQGPRAVSIVCGGE